MRDEYTSKERLVQWIGVNKLWRDNNEDHIEKQKKPAKDVTTRFEGFDTVTQAILSTTTNEEREK